jgi:hypothetical protein
VAKCGAGMRGLYEREGTAPVCEPARAELARVPKRESYRPRRRRLGPGFP